MSSPLMSLYLFFFPATIFSHHLSLYDLFACSEDLKHGNIAKPEIGRTAETLLSHQRTRSAAVQFDSCGG